MIILLQFIHRLSFGLALAMAITPASKVTSGYYRVRCLILLGMNVLGTIAVFNVADVLAASSAAAPPGLHCRPSLVVEMLSFLGAAILLYWPSLVVAMLSFLGAAIWLYEKPRAGRVALLLIAAVSLVGAWQMIDWSSVVNRPDFILTILDPIGGGLLMGTTFAAMFLGHWYLTTPTMELAPLRRLILLMVAATVFRWALSVAGFAFQWSSDGGVSNEILIFLSLRWISGLVGPLILALMIWKTLQVPNTQSATGILYIALVATFVGELTAQLLSAHAAYPL